MKLAQLTMYLESLFRAVLLGGGFRFRAVNSFPGHFKGRLFPLSPRPWCCRWQWFESVIWALYRFLQVGKQPYPDFAGALYCRDLSWPETETQVGHQTYVLHIHLLKMNKLGSEPLVSRVTFVRSAPLPNCK